MGFIDDDIDQFVKHHARTVRKCMNYETDTDERMYQSLIEYRRRRSKLIETYHIQDIHNFDTQRNRKLQDAMNDIFFEFVPSPYKVPTYFQHHSYRSTKEKVKDLQRIIPFFYGDEYAVRRWYHIYKLLTHCCIKINY
jgi:hypothetical protein